MESPVAQEELMRIYALHQKHLAKYRERSKTEPYKERNRANAKSYYERNKEKVLEKRKAYYAEHSEEMKKRYLEAYHRKKAETPGSA